MSGPRAVRIQEPNRTEQMWTIYYVLKRPGPHLVAPHEACARRAVQHARQFLRDRERQSVLAAPLRVGDGRCYICQ